MSQYVAAIWKCRYFWLSLVEMDIRSRYRRSLLGMAWSLLHPIAMTAVLCTVFHNLFHKSVGEYAPSLLVGVCFWNFVTSTMLQGSQCLLLAEKYMRQYPAPVAIYPLRTVLGAAFHFLIALALVVVLRLCFQGFGGLASFVSLVPSLILLLVLGWSLAVLSGFMTAYFPDTRHLAEVALQMAFYATPIIYPPEMLRTTRYAWLVDWNPLAAFIELFRAPLLYGDFPGAIAVAVAGGSTLMIAAAATLTLARLQQKIIFQL